MSALTTRFRNFFGRVVPPTPPLTPAQILTRRARISTWLVGGAALATVIVTIAFLGFFGAFSGGSGGYTAQQYRTAKDTSYGEGYDAGLVDGKKRAATLGAGGFTQDDLDRAKAAGIREGRKLPDGASLLAQVEVDEMKTRARAEGAASRNDEITALTTKVTALAKVAMPEGLDNCDDECKLRVARLFCPDTTLKPADLKMMADGVNMKGFALRIANSCGARALPVAQVSPAGGGQGDPTVRGSYKGDQLLERYVNQKKGQ